MARKTIGRRLRNRYLIQISLLLIPLGLLAYSPMKRAYLCHYKISQIEDGTLYYAPNWGWVDKNHYQACRRWLTKTENEINQSSEDPISVELEGRSTTAYGTQHVTRRTYLIPRSLLDHKDERLVIARIGIDMAVEEERAQEDANFFTGLHWSAWQFDDLPSSVLVALRFVENGIDSGENRTPELITADKLRFRHEGFKLIRMKVDSVGTINSVVHCSHPQSGDLLKIEVFQFKAMDNKTKMVSFEK